MATPVRQNGHMVDEVRITRGDALAIRRLLWDVGSLPSTRHDVKVEAYHYAALLDDLAGMPPWPNDPPTATQQVIDFYEQVASRLEEQTQALRAQLGDSAD